ncbi:MULTISPECIES: DUF11 domain-containing protein [Acinetobacter]|jgi:uncharacterized repeat protein (TIGR01451 family)|uniref:DUF11 domain-containing protein n=1 Tax=Acinetobacter chengduensis TaxID=2420890 RepID=A0ABX9TW94_9GAMM|nr:MULTISPECIES: DUF11 domain-containing protein [Acinetobacter]RKG40255.1 DUF11 domain-containing protein [Acinetobacter sp. WCHAc060007]RLL21734.1 DUF11 domain-containing protein [Acinetobacter chengduensis]
MKLDFKLSTVAASLAVIGGVALASSQLMAATPLAGTNISNIATASYVDNTNTPRTVTSNEVTTAVAQVGSFTLVNDRSATTTPSGKVEMHHVLTNTGNGTDTFTLQLNNKSGGTFDFESGKFAVYLDKNLDGVPDDAVNLATANTAVELKSGESAGLIVVATTPNTATAGQMDQLELVATATQQTLYVSGQGTKSNTDTVTITAGAVVSLTKAASINSAKVGDEIEYTLTFKNTGNATATNVAIFDILPTNVTYVTNSARYSGSTVALTDIETDTDNYQFNLAKKTLLLNIPELAANKTATLKFKVIVNDTQLNTVDNTAYVDPNGKPSDPSDPTKPNVPLEIGDAVPPTTSTPDGPQPSNESKVPVVSVHKGAINDTSTSAFTDSETPAGSGDDEIVLSGQKDGVPIVFGGSTTADGNKIVVHNSGNSVDTYNLTVDRDALAHFAGTDKLPEGTLITILKSDGATPITDTNGDKHYDTGPIQPGQHAEFVIRVTLPNGSTHTVGYSFLVNSTSIATSTVDTLKLATGPITANSVDLVNKETGDPEKGTGTGTNTPVQDKTTPPGTPITYDATIKNNGNVPDNYVITVPNVPTDWKVEIFEKDSSGNCTTTKATNSGNIQNGSEKSFCVTITPPPGTPAGTEKDIKVEIKSPSTGTSDFIVYQVEVAEQRGLTFTPDRQGQVAPGGTVEYVHTLTNTGNVVEGAAAVKADAAKTGYEYDLQLEWTSTMTDVNTSIYVDLNGNGQADTSELITGTTPAALNASLKTLLETSGGTTPADKGLSPNESIQIIVKVQTPATATAGEKDTTILTFTPTGTGAPGAVSITDLTTINLGQVRLSKTQALATACGTVPANTAFVTSNIKAKPGECVYYRVTAVNDGNQNATAVKISDMVPSYTTYVANSIKPTTGTTEPTTTSKEVRYDVGTLTPAATATLEFAVKVDQ